MLHSTSSSPKRVHLNLAKALVEALKSIFLDGKYADSVIKNMLKSNPKWGANDRKFLAESTYDIVRWWRKLWSVYGKEASLEGSSLWAITGIYLASAGYELPLWKEFNEVRNIAINERLKLIEPQRKLRESIPDWLDETGHNELGANWEKELHYLNKQAPVIIRANTLKTTLPELSEALKKEDIETEQIPQHPDALKLDVRKNIFRTTCFSTGLFEVQDAASQEVAYFLDAKPGMRVIDACAGGGGKALHIAALMQNKGKIIAMDVHEWKLKELQKRAARAGVDIIEPRLINSAKVIKRLQKSADRLLLDVPCSGLGVLRRNPDVKWKLTPESLANIRQEQYKILSAYASMLKQGGKMVYATCSILPSENENIVDIFVKKNPMFKKIAEKKILPSQSDSDGFYMAALCLE